MISVLYVDDEPALLDLVKIRLEMTEEFQVATASSAKEGLANLYNARYDAVISDYQMPEMDGIQFLKEVRSSFGDIPFIIFTGRGLEEIGTEALNSGADYYVHKGAATTARFAELAHRLRGAVRQKQSGLAE